MYQFSQWQLSRCLSTIRYSVNLFNLPKEISPFVVYTFILLRSWLTLCFYCNSILLDFYTMLLFKLKLAILIKRIGWYSYLEIAVISSIVRSCIGFNEKGDWVVKWVIGLRFSLDIGARVGVKGGFWWVRRDSMGWFMGGVEYLEWSWGGSYKGLIWEWGWT